VENVKEMSRKPKIGDRRKRHSRARPTGSSLPSEGTYRAIVESAPDAFVIVNRAGVIVLANRQAENLFGYPGEEMLGQPVEMLLPEQYREGHTGQRGNYANLPHPRSMGAGLGLFGRRKDGSEFPADSRLGASIITAVTAATTRMISTSRFQFHRFFVSVMLRLRQGVRL